MTIRTRVLLGFMTVLLVAIGLLVRWTLGDLRLQPKQAMEESLVDLSRVLAGYLEAELNSSGTLDTGTLDEVMRRVGEKRFNAVIYDHHKDRVALRVYVTDETGIVIYDSDGGRDVGRDYSLKNDVYLTLRGGYGVRSSRTIPDDPATAIMVVNAPVRLNGTLVGTVAVTKPSMSVAGFARANTRRLLAASIVVFLAALLAALLVSRWIALPIHRLTGYVKQVRDGDRVLPPDGGGPEIRALSHAFEEMRDTLEDRNYVEQYVQTLTHELKSPLAAIRGAVEVLKDQPAPEDRERFLSHIEHEGERIRLVAEKLLVLAEVEQRKWLEQVEPVDLGDLVGKVSAGLEPFWRPKRVSVHGDGAIGVVNGDAFLLEHAIRNLLDNAIRVSPEGGTVTVLTEVGEGQLKLHVSDQGPGIPAYARDRIWDRFYSVPLADGRRSSGLGLSFVHEVMRLHQGTATCSADAGTVFTLEFPAS